MAFSTLTANKYRNITDVTYILPIHLSYLMVSSPIQFLSLIFLFALYSASPLANMSLRCNAY